jgi:hypothetical protein
MRLSSLNALTASLVLLAASAQAQSSPVSIQFQDGLVSVSARNIPLRTILEEWSRLGRIEIVNAERVSGPPLTIELTNVPEREALATLLRGVAGYVVGAPGVLSTGPARFDRIFILPGNAALGARPSTPPPVALISVQPGVEAPDGAGRMVTTQQSQSQSLESTARTMGSQLINQIVLVEDPAPRAQSSPAPATTPANPFFSGVAGRPGEVTRVP